MRRLRDHPIRRRVALVVVLTSGLTLLIATIAFATVEYAREHARLRAELEVLADVVSENTTAALAFGDRQAAEETLRSLGVAPGFRAAALFDANGRLFAAHALDAHALPAAGPPDGVRFEGDGLAIVQGIELQGRRLGTLHVRRSLAGLWMHLLRQVGLAAGLLLLAALASGVVSRRFQRSISEPLGELEEVARRVAAEGARAARVPVQGDDEVGDALRAFNAMLDDLSAHEAALEAAKLDAEEGARLKSSFLANMSHEIRTPLTSIIGFAEMLTEEVVGEPKEYAELIARGGRRLLDTLNAVLELSRLEAGAARLTTEPVEVAAEVDDVVRLLQPMAVGKGLFLHFDDAAAGRARACLDRVGLGQVVNNLVRNAIKFTDQGDVRVSVAADAERVRVEVSDTGDGIDDAFVPYLFDEFRQESDGLARRHEGVGLGLAISRRLVEMMGGQIAVWSRKGVGSVFTVSFPRVDPELAGRTTSAAATCDEPEG